MKKLSALLLALCAAVCVCAFAACGEKDDSQATGDTTVTATETSVIFTVDGDFLTLTDETSLYDYLVALQNAGKLTFDGSSSDWGFAINSINGKEPVYETNSCYYWAQYTSLTAIDGVYYSSDYSTYDNNGQTLYSNSYYCDGMPAVDGETYAFIYEYTSW